MNLGLLVLRLIVGGLIAAHGAQKLFGWFGGPGPDRTAAFFQSIGLHPGREVALGAGVAEIASGILLALGFGTPVAAFLLSAVMLSATATVHLQKGPWAGDGGYEYNLVLLAVAFALTAVGAGSWSLDGAFDLADAGAGWAVTQLLLGFAGATATIELARRRGGRADPLRGEA